MKKKLLTTLIISCAVLASGCKKDQEAKNLSPTPVPTVSGEQSDTGTLTPEEGADNVTSIPLDELFQQVDSTQVPILDEDTGFIHYQGFVYSIEGEEASIVNYDWVDSEDMVLPSSLTYEDKEYPVTSIGKEAFFYCPDIVSLTIPEGIQTIESDAFYGCDALAEINFPSSLKRIENAAFYGCTSLTKVTLPEGLQSLGNEVFCSCENLSEILIPDTVQEIGEDAFYECVSLEHITLPASLTNLAKGIFSNCTNLKEIILPEGLVSIGEEAFWYCEALESLDLPKNLAFIGNRAFYVSGIQELTLPSGLASLTEETLDGSDNLKRLYVPKDKISYYEELLEYSNVKILSAESKTTSQE